METFKLEQRLVVSHANGGPEFSAETRPTEDIGLVDVHVPMDSHPDDLSDADLLRSLQLGGLDIREGDRISWVFQNCEAFVMRDNKAIYYFSWEEM